MSSLPSQILETWRIHNRTCLFLIENISHEAHHRGGILLTMKQCGIKIPDTLKWGIWEWNKI